METKTPRISQRQRAIIIGLSNGQSVESIAFMMNLSKRTIMRDISIAKSRLGILKSRFTVGALVARAYDAGLPISGYALNSNGQIVVKIKSAVRRGVKP